VRAALEHKALAFEKNSHFIEERLAFTEHDFGRFDIDAGTMLERLARPLEYTQLIALNIDFEKPPGCL
jgi:hypothetical protein